MTNCIFYTMFLALFLNLSFGSLRLSQVNRVFMSIYKGMLEASVLTISDDGEPVVPYYNKVRFEEYVDSYLKQNISKYLKEYIVNTRYYSDDQYTVCESSCRKASINLKANINVFYKYDKTQTFVIRSSQDYE